MDVDVTRVTGFLARMQEGNSSTQSKSPASEAFQELLRKTSDIQKSAGEAANRLLTTGEGELHEVQTQLAKAELTFRFLVEVRNKLSEAYQEVSRLNV